MRYPPRLPRVPIEIQPNPLNLSSSASKEGVFNIYGGEAGNKALSVYDGSTAFLTIDPDNSITTGKHISIKATPEASSAATIVEIEADGTNWGANSSCLKLISDDNNCYPLQIFSGATEKSNISRGGALTLAGNITLSAGGSIDTTANGDITLLPNGTGITIIGDAGSTAHSLAANDDLFVTGKLEVKGAMYFDGSVNLYAGLYMKDNWNIYLGTGSDAGIVFSTVQASEHTVLFGLGGTAKSIIFCDKEDTAKDFDHAAQSNPTIIVHSATDPDTANTQWISITHNQTDGVIDVGLGTLNLGSGGHVVNFVGSSVTGSTVTHDAYCEIEVAGVLKKFMLGS